LGQIGVTPGHDILGRSRHDGDEESNARIKLTSALSPPFVMHADVFASFGRDFPEDWARRALRSGRAKSPN
ncbi:MAG TPA: hypothetical protein VGP23_06715, partial [Candidatus Binataceae bacterium]|nr:hypothetical protein [Candidatus Binataceae bacterium]